MTPRIARIRTALTDLDPVFLEVIDESSAHRGGSDAQSHYKVVIVSPAFRGQSLVERHRAVQSRLQAEFAAGVHALALSTYDPEQWEQRQGQTPQSPACRGSTSSS